MSRAICRAPHEPRLRATSYHGMLRRRVPAVDAVAGHCSRAAAPSTPALCSLLADTRRDGGSNPEDTLHSASHPPPQSEGTAPGAPIGQA